ncbi:MAG: ATP-binding protein [Haloarculaceae archaeon]
MRQRTKLAIGLLLLTFVLLAGVFGVTEWFQRRTVDRTERAVNQTATVTAEQISSLVKTRKDYVGYVASRPEASNFERSKSFLTEFLGNSRFFAAYITDANGRVVDFRGGIAPEVRNRTIGENHADRRYVRAALNGSVYMTDPEYADSTDKYLVLVSAPIVESDGTVAGTLVGSIYLTPNTFFLPVVPLENSFQTVTIHSGQDVFYEGQQSFENPIAATEPIEGTDWVLTVSRDRARLQRQLRTLLVAQEIGVLFIVLAMITFGAWDYRSNLRQTQRLLDGFDAIGRGEYDYDLSMESGEEWMQISDGFNDLADGLAARERAIREREQRLGVLNRVLRHNLRNEMSVVINYADVIASQADDATLRDAASIISRTGRELAELGHEVRRMEDAMEETDELTRTDLVVVLRNVLEDLQSEYPDVTLTTALPRSAVVVGVPALELAVENVVENAFKHNDGPDPHVGVSVTRADETVTLVVGDNGPGLSDQEWRPLVSGEETDLEHGSGIGLWNAYWVVDQSDGDVEFLRTEPTGTVIRMTFQVDGDDNGHSDGDDGGHSAAGDA